MRLPGLRRLRRLRVPNGCATSERASYPGGGGGGEGMETAFSIFLAVAESLVAAFIYDAYKAGRSKNMVIAHSAAKEYTASSTDDDYRKKNRDLLISFFRFVFTFYAIYAAIHLPLMIKSWQVGGELFLDQARFLGGMLPHWSVDAEILQLPSAVLAALVYFPVLYLSVIVALPIVGLIDQFTPTTSATLIAVRIIIFGLLSLLVSIGVVYLYFDVTPQEAFMSVGTLLFFAAGLSGSSGRRR